MDPDDFMSSHGTWVQTNKDTWKLFGITEMSLSAWNKGANTKLSVITKQQEEGQEKRNEELLELATTRHRGLSTWNQFTVKTLKPLKKLEEAVDLQVALMQVAVRNRVMADGRKVSAYTLASLHPHRFQYYHHHHDRGEPTERGVKSPKSKQSGRCWRVVRNTAMVWSTMDEGDLTKVTGHRTLSAAVSAGWDAVRK